MLTVLQLISSYKISLGQSWITVSPSNYARLESACVEVDGKMYIFSGFYNYWNLTRVTEVYDPEADKWSILSSMPEYRTHQGFAVDGDNVWLAGGWADQYKIHEKTVLIYNISTDKWSYGPPLPVGTSSFAMVRLGRKLHVIGGLQGGMENDTGVHYVLDLDNTGKGWSSASALPVPRNHHSAAVVGGKIYVLGGQQGHDGPVKYLKDLHVYDPFTDTWDGRADLPTARSHYEPGTTVYDGKIIIAGGRNVSDISNISEYNPETDQWSELAPLPFPILAPNAKVIKEKLVVANGATSEPLKTARVRPINRAGSDKLIFWPLQLNYTFDDDQQPLSSTFWLSTLNNKVNYTLAKSTSASWMSIERISGNTDPGGAEIQITFDTEALEPGEYKTEVIASSPGYSDAIIPIFVTVAGEPIENKPPVVDAGQDQVIILPENSVTLNGTASDPDGEIISYLWTKENGPSATMEGENTLNLELTGLVAGNYVFRLTVTDDKNVSSFDEVNLTVVPAGNKPPEVNIISPENNAVFQTGDAIIIEADALDEDGEISKVEFFAGNTKIGEKTSAPYQVTWNDATSGNHELKAQATDDNDISIFSPSINILVREPDSPPIILLTSPASGSEFFEQEDIIIEVEVIDEQSIITKIEYYANDIKLGEELTSPYSFIWQNAEQGSYQLLAKGYTSGNEEIFSETVEINVLPAIATGIEDNMPIYSVFNIYPVPSSGNVFVEFQVNNRENYSMELYDSQGKIVQKISSGKAEAGFLHKFEIEGQILTKGIYLVKLKLGNINTIQKFIVKK